MFSLQISVPLSKYADVSKNVGNITTPPPPPNKKN